MREEEDRVLGHPPPITTDYGHGRPAYDRDIDRERGAADRDLRDIIDPPLDARDGRGRQPWDMERERDERDRGYDRSRELDRDRERDPLRDRDRERDRDRDRDRYRDRRDYERERERSPIRDRDRDRDGEPLRHTHCSWYLVTK